MLSKEGKEKLEKQHYKIIGNHSSIKVCGWTKKMIKGEGNCYKHKFYGIRSNQCLQMSTSFSCANRCTFCWRDYKAPVSKEWQWEIDDPKEILDQSIKAHIHMLNGYPGHPKTIQEFYKEALTIKHVALSLIGEPIIYPKINELIDECHKRGISTFLVTNAQYPEQIRNLKPITQLYYSVDAPNKEILKQIDNPLFEDYWERLLESLDILAERKDRTCIRLTLVKKINMTDLEGYATLINRGNPDFIELKSYMLLGASKDRLTLDNAPFHEDVVKFTKTLIKHLPNYDIVSEHIPSRVILLAKKEFKINNVWHTWIDFNKEFTKSNILPTPETGLSGKGTLENMNKPIKELELWEED
ncbi:MAG: 4-demethylwyosine synthase TYW1 [Nanoarchaeota archaeon]|nr:4-demethylwyosine synthase TYW1 [Nanoarchaeota archaeon]